MTETDIAFLEQLESIVADRLQNPVQGSYTSGLVAAGIKRIAQKVGEEAVELALASVAGDRDEIVDEAADLFFHLLVLLHAQDVRLADVAAALKRRHED